MTPEDLEQLKTSIRVHEGLSLKPIPDSKGSLSIGYGRSLTFTGITKDEAEMMLERDIRERRASLSMLWPTFITCDGPRQRVLTEMAYQLGVVGLLQFERMLEAVARKDYAEAARDILNSKLALQTPARAAAYAAVMQS